MHAGEKSYLKKITYYMMNLDSGLNVERYGTLNTGITCVNGLPRPRKKTPTRGQRGCFTVSPCKVCVTHATLPMLYLCRSDVSSVARGHSELPTPPSCGYRGCFFAGAVQGRSLTRLGMKSNTGEMPYLIDYWPIFLNL